MVINYNTGILIFCLKPQLKLKSYLKLIIIRLNLFKLKK